MFGLASEMLLFSFSLPFSLCVLVNYLVKFHHLPMLLTLEFCCLLILFADAMSIPCGLQILKVI
jgi:hypothetical protein